MKLSKAWPHAALILSVAAVTATMVQGCTALVVDASEKQCSTDDDCRSLGPDFVGSFCNQQNICTRAVDYCSTNIECIQRTGVANTICRKDTNKCVALENAQCKVLAEPKQLEDDTTVIFGVHGIPSWAPSTKACENAIELARRGFQSTQGGLPPTKATGGKPRPVAWLSCDVPIGQQNLHKAVTDHLFKEVGVTATLGPFATIDSVVYAFNASLATGIPMYTVAEDQPSYDLPGKAGLMFLYSLPKGAVVIGQTNAVALLEPLIRARGITRDIKIAYAYVEGIGENDALNFFQQVRFNNKSATDNGPTLFQEYSYGSTSDPNFIANISAVVIKIAQFKPDILILRGSDADVGQVAAQTESAIPGVPYYVLPVEGLSQATGIVGRNESLRKRTLGFAPGKYDQDPSIVELNLRYNAAFPETGTSPLESACSDIAYAMYYGAAGAGDVLTGKTMGQSSLTRFKPTATTTIHMTPSFVLPGFAALQGGQDLRVEGAQQVLDFDPVSGVNRDWRIAYWCVAPPSLIPAPPAATDPRVVNGIMELNIGYAFKDPVLRGALVGPDGKAITAVPAGCLSTD